MTVTMIANNEMPPSCWGSSLWPADHDEAALWPERSVDDHLIEDRPCGQLIMVKRLCGLERSFGDHLKGVNGPMTHGICTIQEVRARFSTTVVLALASTDRLHAPRSLFVYSLAVLALASTDRLHAPRSLFLYSLAKSVQRS